MTYGGGGTDCVDDAGLPDLLGQRLRLISGPASLAQVRGRQREGQLKRLGPPALLREAVYDDARVAHRADQEARGQAPAENAGSVVAT
jgi:hypothetical protein